ncbi:hypothetical protein BC835DRAFT_1408700 [Cytidiella melzeri]|nr:hypothetical protein BC835DRAFT_1408700 [Cytidiella melzeri]
MDVDDTNASSPEQPRAEDRVAEEGGRESASGCARGPESDFVYVKQFPLERQAGKVYGEAEASFERVFQKQKKEGTDSNEWDLAKWLSRNVGHNQADKFLHLPIIKERVNASFASKDHLLKAIDALPTGTSWKSQLLKVTGDLKSDEGVEITEELELWFRDPVECICELIGNPRFQGKMLYAPEQLFEDPKEEHRVWNEMSTGDWWWETQLNLPNGATCAPVIVSSDKTKLSQFRGDKSAWPVYLTLGNINKSICRQPSARATILLGYIPVPKLDCCTEKAKKATRYNLFHRCMRLIFESLANAGTNGVMMTCADAKVRWIFPVLAAYVADYPEQCLVTCCMENHCPECPIPADQRGEHQDSEAYITRDQDSVLNLLREDSLGSRTIDLPRSNIFTCFTPNLLHQLHNGVFKDHLVQWCTELIGELELDDRFRAVPTHPNLHHFKNGISSVSQWTGCKHKEMQKVFVAIIADAVKPEVVRAASAAIDFIYFASCESHSSHTLDSLRATLSTFHAYKDIFIRLGARNPEHFNIPKIHALQHYARTIRMLGSADGYSTEAPERLHIDYAKDAYQASNKRDYVIQMVNWLQRQEAVYFFDSYLKWVSGRSELKNIPASQIISDHHAGQFIHALTNYLRANHCGITPQSFDTFDLYNRVSVDLPIIPETSSSHCADVVRAIAPTPRKGRKPAEPGHFDFALVRTNEPNTHTMHTALSGS